MCTTTQTGQRQNLAGPGCSTMFGSGKKKLRSMKELYDFLQHGARPREQLRVVEGSHAHVLLFCCGFVCFVFGPVRII